MTAPAPTEPVVAANQVVSMNYVLTNPQGEVL